MCTSTYRVRTRIRSSRLGAVIGVVVTCARSPRIWTRRSRSRCVLPLGFGEQPIPTPGSVGKPAHVVLRILPAHADGWVGVGLREADVSPGAVGVRLAASDASSPRAAGTRLARRGDDKGGPLASRDGELRGRELGDAHDVLGPLALAPPRLAGG